MRKLLLAALLCVALPAQATIIEMNFDGQLSRVFESQDPLGIIDFESNSIAMTARMVIDTSRLDLNRITVSATSSPDYPAGTMLEILGYGTDWITDLDIHIGDLHFTRSMDPLFMTIHADQPRSMEGSLLGLSLAPAYGYDSLNFDLRELRFCKELLPQPGCFISHSDPNDYDFSDPVASLLSSHVGMFHGTMLGDLFGESLGIASGVWTSTVQVPEPGTLALFGLGLAGLVAANRKRKISSLS